jgi:hypothetical protein
MRFAGLFQQAGGFGAAECSGFWCGGQRLTFSIRFRISATEISNTRCGIFGACGPKACFIGKACAARGDGTSLSRQGALRITRSGFRRALFGQIGTRRLDRFAEKCEVRCGFARLHACTARGFRFGQFGADAFQLRGKRGETVFHL